MVVRGLVVAKEENQASSLASKTLTQQQNTRRDSRRNNLDRKGERAIIRRPPVRGERLVASVQAFIGCRGSMHLGRIADRLIAAEA
jgi:hypothetical protein